MTDRIRRILIVEAEASLADSIRYNLEREGYEVVVAYDGREAIRLARRESPDLVLLDLMLPMMSGLDVCRSLRAEVFFRAPESYVMAYLFSLVRAVRGETVAASQFGKSSWDIAPENYLTMAEEVRLSEQTVTASLKQI